MPQKTRHENEQETSDLGPDAYYFAALKSGKFLIQACNGCRKHVFYPHVLCPHCGTISLA